MTIRASASSGGTVDGSDLEGRPHRGPPRPLLVAGVALVEVVGTHFASLGQTGVRPFDAGAALLLVAGAGSLWFGRRWPAGVLVFVFAATLAYWLLDYPRGPIWLALVVALFGAVMAGRRAVALSVLVIGYVSFMWLGYALGSSPRPSAQAAVAVAAWLAVLVTAAEAARGRKERAAEAARTRAEAARRRSSEERMRIARDLHDVLAHNISLINVQAGVGLHLLDERPDQARGALAAIKDASNDALRELRSVLDILRQGNESPPLLPTPGLAQLDDLVRSSEAAGVEVVTTVEGTPRPAPAGTDAAAYRIVQEALTNVRRHAGGAGASVRLAYSIDGLVIEVTDDGRAAPGAAGGGGSGIPGMRERAAAVGGRLEAGPGRRGGFVVRAELPLPAAGTEAAP